MRMKGTLYYYFVNMRYSLMIFWGILIGIMLLNILLEVFFGETGVNIYFSFALPIYLFAVIMGAWVVKNVIPYLVKMGVTRMAIYIGTGITFILLVLFNGVVSNTLQTLITDVFNSSVNSSVELTLNGEDISASGGIIGLFTEDTWWNRLVIDVSMQFSLVAVSFLFAMVFYRFRLVGGSVLLGVLLFAFIYSVTSGWLYDTAVNIFSDFSMFFFYQLFLAGLVIYLISLILLRKLTV